MIELLIIYSYFSDCKRWIIGEIYENALICMVRNFVINDNEVLCPFFSVWP